MKYLDIDFDPYHVPDNKFLFAGKAWELCRSNKENPECFGIQGLTGLSFIKANIIRDLFALRKIETLPWDMGWGMLNGSLEQIKDSTEISLIDTLAAISKNSDEAQAIEAIKLPTLALPMDWNWSKCPTIEQLING